MMTRNTFQILTGFLEREDDVEGRALPEPPAETQQTLRLLARGALPREEQAQVFATLNKNPDWIAWLAQEVKGLRTREQ